MGCKPRTGFPALLSIPLMHKKIAYTDSFLRALSRKKYKALGS